MGTNSAASKVALGIENLVGHSDIVRSPYVEVTPDILLKKLVNDRSPDSYIHKIR